MSGNKSAVYLNTAGCGLIPEAVLQAGIDLYKNFELVSSATSEHWRSVTYPQIKQTVARFLGAAPEQVALIPNCSWGINALVQSLKGDERILLYKKDFPSLYLPFVTNKFNISWIDDEDGFRIDLDKIVSVIREEKIDIVVMSHVQWQSGFKTDLQALCDACRAMGVHSIIDATQSLGALPVDVSVIRPDVLIGSNYKWMNAGFGTGILYIDAAFLEKYPPVTIGLHSNAYTDSMGVAPLPIGGYEPGGLDMFGLTILQKAISLKEERGMEAIGAHNAALTQVLLDRLVTLPVQLLGAPDMQQRSSIVVIAQEEGLPEHLAAHNIVTTLRNGRIRISMHFDNVADDVEAIAACIGSWAKQAVR